MCTSLTISECITAFGNWFSGHWLFGTLVVIFSCWRLYFGGMLSKKGSAEKISSRFKYNTYSESYRSLLDWSLRLVDKALHADEVGKEDWRQYWSAVLFDRCLLISTAYPLLILVGVWAYSNEEIRFASQPVLEDDVNPWLRLVVALSFFVLIVCSVYSAFKKTVLEKVKYIAIAAVGAGVLVFSGELQVSGAVSSALLGAFVGMISLGVLISKFPVIGENGPGARVAMVAVVGAAAGALGAAEMSIWIAIVSSVWVLSIAVFLGYLTSRPTSGIVVYGTLMLLLLMSLVAPAIFAAPLDKYAAGVVLFLAILPITNAIFDYLSIGLTRWALSHGVKSNAKRVVLWSLVDVVGALVIFVALKTSTLILIIALNVASGDAADGLIDVPTFLKDVSSHKGDFWWLYIPFLTTLIPTLLHLFLALFSLVNWLPEKIASRWSRLSDERDDWESLQEVKWGASLWATIVAVPPVLLVAAAYNFHSYYSTGVSETVVKFVKAILELGNAI